MSTTQPPNKKLSPALKQELRQFCQTHDIERVNRNLRRMLLDYLDNELRIGIPVYLEEFIWQVGDLFELLDVLHQETKHWQQPPVNKEG